MPDGIPAERVYPPLGLDAQLGPRHPGRAAAAPPATRPKARPSSTSRLDSEGGAHAVDVLAIAAHPDDVELTCGGTLARLKAAGYRFGIVDLTRGEMGTRGSAEIRGKEAARAAEILGAEFREALDLGDGGLRRGREEELAVIDVIRREKPRLILTPYPDDRHPDHRRAGQLVTDAAFYAGLRKLETAHPAHRPQQTVYFPTFDPQTPTFVVDVTPYIEIRRAAMRAFESQFHDPELDRAADHAVAEGLPRHDRVARRASTAP